MSYRDKARALIKELALPEEFKFTVDSISLWLKIGRLPFYIPTDEFLSIGSDRGFYLALPTLPYDMIFIDIYKYYILSRTPVGKELL